MRISTLGAVGLMLAAGSAFAQQPTPLGNQIQVNSYTTNGQERAEVTADGQGGFVVVWESLGSSGTDTSHASVHGRRYDANGTSVGGPFQVNSYTTSNQRRPTVVADALGNFVVFWYSAGSYGTDTSNSVQGQRYDSSSTPVGGEFQVNSYTTGTQGVPAAAADADGNFVVAWTSYGSYGTDSSLSVQGQRFDSDGVPVGGQFQVNTYTTSYQRNAAVALDALGRFVVVWESNGSSGSDTSSYSVQGQRYDSDGTPNGGQFQVNSYTTYRQQTAAVASDADGNFVVVWESQGSYGTDSNETSVQAQRYDSSGTPIGIEFQVNSFTTSFQGAPAVDFNADGDFIVVWESDGSYENDHSNRSIQGQWYGSSGTPIAEQFQVNSYTTNIQRRPATVVLDSQGRFVAVWESIGSYSNDNREESVQAQRFERFLLFNDGFESGDTQAWSVTMP